jgi:hypothetical protein
LMRGAVREDSPNDSGTFMFGSSKRKFVDCGTDSRTDEADAMPFNGNRDADADTNEITRKMSYLELCDQVKVLTGLVMDNQNSNMSLSKRFKNERDFGSAGNKSQHTVNSEVIDLVEEAFYALSTGNVINVENCLNEIRRLMVERNKLVLIADTSEFGWAAAKAYSNNATFLSDEEDKRLKRIEGLLRAAKKERTESAPKPKGRGTGRGRGGKQQNNNEQVPVVATPQQANTSQYHPQMFSYTLAHDPYTPYAGMPPFPAMAGHFPGQVMQAYAPSKANIKCYGCQQFGHLKTDCPNRHLWANPSMPAITK